MAFVGIDSVVFTPPDMAEAKRFFADWGLKKVKDGRSGTVFATEVGSQVVLKPRGAKGLPEPPDPGGAFREVVWGLASRRDLDRIARELARDHDLSVEDDGTVHTRDPNGIAVGFRVWRHRKGLNVRETRFNTAGVRHRVDRPSPIYQRARPLRIGHIVFLAADMKAGEAFYTKRLGFRLTDRYSGGRAVFLRCSAENEHHNLFFLNTHGAKTELQHVAFEVRDIHEVFGGGIHMKRRGWPTEVGPGRHPVSSAYFWYFHSPCGGAVEYYSDSDYATEAWKPRSFRGVRFSEWHVPDGVGPAVGGRVADARQSP